MAISFALHPADSIVIPGETFSPWVFTSEEDSTTSYQWQKDGVDISDGGDVSGATTFHLTVANAVRAYAGEYTCDVISGVDASTATSNAAAITVPVQDGVLVYSKSLWHARFSGYAAEFTSLSADNPTNVSDDWLVGNSHKIPNRCEENDHFYGLFGCNSIVGDFDTALNNQDDEFVNTKATIVRARLRFLRADRAASQWVDVFKMITNTWDIDFASWNNRNDGVTWSTPGAFGGDDVEGTATSRTFFSWGLSDWRGIDFSSFMPGDGDYVYLDITADVDTWFKAGGSAKLSWLYKGFSYIDPVNGGTDVDALYWDTYGHLQNEVAKGKTADQAKPAILLDWAFIDSDGYSIAIPDENDWFDIGCTADITSEDQSVTVSSEFGRAIIFDMNTGTIHPCYGFPWTCSLASSSPCAWEGFLPDNMYVGDANGYISRALVEQRYGLGNPTSQTRWALTGDSTDTILSINSAATTNFFPASMLPGLTIFVQYADGTLESGIVSSNTTETLTLTAALAGGAPAADDVLFLAPMPFGVMFREQRFEYPASLRSVLINADKQSDETQDLKIEVITAEDPETQLDMTEPSSNREFTTTDFQVGTGRVFVPSDPSVALSYALRGFVSGGGPLKLESFHVEEDVHPAETTRGG